MEGVWGWRLNPTSQQNFSVFEAFSFLLDDGWQLVANTQWQTPSKTKLPKGKKHEQRQNAAPTSTRRNREIPEDNGRTATPPKRFEGPETLQKNDQTKKIRLTQTPTHGHSFACFQMACTVSELSYTKAKTLFNEDSIRIWLLLAHKPVRMVLCRFQAYTRNKCTWFFFGAAPSPLPQTYPLNRWITWSSP